MLVVGRHFTFSPETYINIAVPAHSYKFASYLPAMLWDGLLNLPHFLIGVRNRLLMTQPFRQPPAPSRPPVPSPYTARPKSTPTVSGQSLLPAGTGIQQAGPEAPPSEHDENSSESDVDSVAGDSSVGSSWVSLSGNQTHLQGEATV